MNRSDLEAALPVEGAAAPPRANGELIFEAPWQSRLFGVTMSLHAAGLFEWREFQASLIAEIQRWEAGAAEGATYHYYERWQAALEDLLAAKGICPPEALAQRSSELAARPHGHDH
jgi:nitrile hydratase accessory protein